MTHFEEVVAAIQRTTNVSHERAVEVARKNGVSDDRPRGPVVDEGALEKAHEHEGDKLLLSLGFEVVRFSHPGRTKQTPGIPDRRYYRRRDRFVFWWEVKSETGRQRPDQRVFQEMAEACGEHYVLGTYADLESWLRAMAIVAIDRDGCLVDAGRAQ